MMYLGIVNSLGKALQRGNLPIKNVYCPPDLSTSLERFFAQMVRRHISMHARRQR